MKKLSALITLLLVLVASSSAIVGQSQPPPNSPPEEGGKRPDRPPPFTPEMKEKFRQRIGITEKQQGQLDKLFEESFSKRHELNQQLRQLLESRDKVYEVYEFDRKQESSVRRDIQNVYTQLLNLHRDTEEKIRKVLNQEQFDKLRELQKEMRKKWQSDKQHGHGRDRGPISP